MRLERVFLAEFRNYHRLDLGFCSGTNLLVGDNAQGKTNLLEAIYVIGTGRSHRTGKDAELALWGADHYLVKGAIVRESVRTVVEIAFGAERGKRARVNGREQDRVADVFGLLNVVMFTPDDLQLVKGGPAERRRFMDIEIAQVSPGYRYHLTQYVRAHAQRNALLKEVKNRTVLRSLVEAWDEQLVEHGLAVMAKRDFAIRKLSGIAAAVHPRIAGTAEAFGIRYVPSVQVDFGSSPEAQKSSYREMLEGSLADDSLRGLTLLGPHRDDVQFEIDGTDVRTFGSQGQQRTAVLALKLSEIEFMKSETGEFPVLLLDDVLSELDESRRAHLLEAVRGPAQTFITSAGLDPVCREFMSPGSGKDSCMFRVNAGQVVRCEP